MKQITRILRALFIRLVFIGYSLACIWRVTFVSDNKYYWLMMISIGFLLIETGVLLWLRGGKEFRGILPSVLFFLSCVVPSLWIMNLDEANRRNNFHLVAEHQEGRIKDFVKSLDLPAKTDEATTTIRTTLTPPLQTGPAVVETTTLLTSTITTALMQNLTENASLVISDRMELESNIECCDVKISYWFQEDAWHNLFIQSLLLILVISRWLITRTEFTINKRSLILIISLATAADTLNFFCYLNLEIVYRNKYLLYSALLIISLSLLQFVFLHLEEHNTNLAPNQFMEKIDMSNIYDTDDERGTVKRSKNYPFIFQQYEQLKQNQQPNYTASAFYQQYQPSKNPIGLLYCCCLEQQDPIFFILLAGLFLHDGSYLTFRVFLLSRLGLHDILNLDPTFAFFMMKNIFIIVTQLYKVYSVTTEKRHQKLMNDYRSLIIANQQCHQNKQQQQQHQSTNPYRFAQLYADVGSPLASKVPFLRSMSNLASNPIYFENASNLFKPALPPALFTNQNQAHLNTNKPSLNTSQDHTSTITDSVLALMAKDYVPTGANKHAYKNDSFYFPHSQLTTPANPFSSKIGKALYGLPFMNRKSNLQTNHNFTSGGNNTPSGFLTPVKGQTYSGNTTSANNNKLMKSSKI